LQRVRVLDRPPSDYRRFVMDLARRRTIPAGEELRVLDRDDAEAMGVRTGSDFWLFDDRIMAAMTFDDGRFVGAEITLLVNCGAGQAAVCSAWNRVVRVLP
jgi:uncharacterized protein DUF6879